ncbi:MAG: GNAT family N-acetyltransferase [Deltaproteobacteria bacterium]|nr:GNAT family N-acetyltransferase [Deltaproteobacteria bacterium]
MTRGELTIHAGRGQDLSALGALWAELDARHAAHQPAFFQTAPPREVELRDMLKDPHALLLVALKGQEVVGGVSAGIFDTPNDPGMVRCRRLYVDRLVVAAEHRGQGVGRALMDSVEERGRSRGAEQLVLTVWAGNEEALRFYQREGLVEVGRLLAREL